MHLHYKPRMRSGKAVPTWRASQETKNRGITGKYTYFPPPVVGDGIWTERVSENVLNAVSYGNSKWIAGGVKYPLAGYVVSSSDGISWQEVNTPFNVYVNDIAYANGIFVLVGAKLDGSSIGIQKTTDGVTWTSVSYTTNRSFNKIKYGNGKWIICLSGYSNEYTQKIIVSSDTVSWTEVSFPSTPSSNINLAFGNNLWMTVIDNIVRTSSDGITWSTVSSNNFPQGYIEDLSFGNGTWIVSGYDVDGLSKVYYSTDNGQNWNISLVIDDPYWYVGEVPYSGGIFFAVGNIFLNNESKVFLSYDGINWYSQRMNYEEYNFVYDVGWANGIAVAVGESGAINTSIQQVPIVKNGLVLHLDSSNINSYPQSGTSWYDLSGNNNNGSFVRTVTYTNTNGGELNFASKSYSSHPNSPSLQFGSVFTIQAWIRPTNLSARHSIFSTRLNASSGGFSLECGTNEAGNNRIGVSGVGTWVYRSNNNVIPLNQWTNVAYVRNGATQTMYVNGVAITPASTVSYNIINNTANKTVGIGNIETTEFFGAIPKVYVYNRPLTADEVNQNYHATKAQYV